MNLASIQVRIRGNQRAFSYRENSTGDKGVIDQILVNGDYRIAHWTQGRRLIEHHRTQSVERPSLIVDAGANIGASALFFACNYENSLVFAIEPDKSNWDLLSANTAGLNCVAFHGAVGGKDGELLLVDPGRSDWGFMTTRARTPSATGIGKVPCLSPNSILKHPGVGNARPLIFKIDIEGGEDDLFDGDTDWMNEFPLLIIELHDWMLPFAGSSRNFIRALARHDFDVLQRGENMFLFNRRLLG